MAYEIRYSDFVNKGSIVIEDNTINQETSLKLPGRNTTAYGSSIAENFLHLLENFANATQPSSPVEGQLWYDNSPGVDQLKLWDGSTWVAAGGLKKANIAPDAENSVIGDLWVDTDNQQLYLFAGSGWLLVGPQFAEGLATGSRPDKIVAIDNNEYDVVFIEAKGKPVAIISSEAFSPKATIEGFEGGIRPGINLSAANIAGDGVSQFNGISEKALGLVIPGVTTAQDILITAANVMRKDAINLINYPIAIKNPEGLSIGETSELKLTIDGFGGVISHAIPGSNLQIRMNPGTQLVDENPILEAVLTVDSSRKVGINKAGPEQELDVSGIIQSDEQIKVTSLLDSGTVNSGSIITTGGAGIAKNLSVGGQAKIQGPLTVGRAPDSIPLTSIDLSEFGVDALRNTYNAAIVPDENNLRTIGTPTRVFSAMYATEFIGSLRGEVQGSVSGRSGQADRLSSPTVFQVTGDVTANNVSFDGQQGTVTFTTAVSNNFIANRPDVIGAGVNAKPVPSEDNDEFLVNKPEGVFKMPRSRILAGVKAIVPVGTVIPYAGIINDIEIPIPDGWLVCDGGIYLIAEYADLHSLIQWSFLSKSLVQQAGFDPEKYFAVPDMRGRFPLGADIMGEAGNAQRIINDSADAIGGNGGVEQVSLELTNLPEHEHDMINDMDGGDGSQFYAFSDTSTVANLGQGGTVEKQDLVGTGTGALYAGTGGVLSQETIGQAFDTLSPFLTLNYLIYAGE